MSSVKLYHDPNSAPSRGALFAARVIGVPVEVEIINLSKNEQMEESFLKINPQHCVPTMVEDNFVLWESRAIACYLADKYGKDDQWYPKELRRRAVVVQRLHFDSSVMYVNIRDICFSILFLGETEVKNALKDDMNRTLGFLEQFLSGNLWVTGNTPTIADTSIYSSLSTLLVVGWDMSPFPNIQKWVENCSSLPGAAENDEGAKNIGERVKKNLKQ